VPVLLLNFGIGVFYVGPFMAVLPVVRDSMAGRGRARYVNLAFWPDDRGAFAFAGWHASDAAWAARRRAVSWGSVILLCMALQPPFWLLNALCFTWGWGGHHAHQAHRVQIVAPPTHRARLMSLLAGTCGRPIGAFIAGSLAPSGLKLAMILPALAMRVIGLC